MCVPTLTLRKHVPAAHFERLYCIVKKRSKKLKILVISVKLGFERKNCKFGVVLSEGMRR